jgi:hypothetical protein
VWDRLAAPQVKVMQIEDSRDKMKSQGDKYLESIERIRQDLDTLFQMDYTPENVNRVLSQAGVETELFLKYHIFPAASKRENFVELITKLGTCGLDVNSVDILNKFRVVYNSSKHDPSFEISAIDAKRSIANLLLAMKQVISIGIGNSSAPVSVPLRRLVWLAAWDHYIGGDTEVHIILPIPTKHYLGPPEVDIIYIEMSDWDDVKKELALVGTLLGWEGHIPNDLYEQYRSEDDFLAALVFDGDYKQLLRILSKHERREELLPDLLRASHYQSMLTAFVMATIDVAQSGCANSTTYKAMIEKQAIEVYAVPLSFGNLQRFSTEFSNMCDLIHPNSILLSGPSWVGEYCYKQLSTTAIYSSDEFGYLVDKDLVIRMK